MYAAISRRSALAADPDREGVEVIGEVDSRLIAVRHRILFPAHTVVQGQFAADLPLIAGVEAIFPLAHLQVRLVNLDPLIRTIEPAQQEVGESIVLVGSGSAVQDRRGPVEDETVLADLDVIRELVEGVKARAKGVRALDLAHVSDVLVERLR